MLAFGAWHLRAQGIDLRPVFTTPFSVCHKTQTHPAPMPSRVPTPRQHILRITRGIGFLGYPSPQRHTAWPPARHREPLRVAPFRVSILRDVRVVLYAVSHLSGGNHVIAEYVAEWGQVPVWTCPSAGLADSDSRRFNHTFAFATHSHLLGAVAARGWQPSPFSPLHSDV